MENYEVIEAQHVETNTYKILLLILEEPKDDQSLLDFFKTISKKFATEYHVEFKKLIEVSFQHQRRTSVAELIIEVPKDNKLKKYLYQNGR